MNEKTNSSHALQIFESPQFGQIRAAGTSDEPLFCLADICKVLELQVSPTKNRLKSGGVTSIKVGVQTGVRADGTPAIQDVEMIFINEQNLYRLIMRSDKPQAEAFQDWVCGEVLPEIRKNGGYMAARADETEEELMARAFIMAKATIDRQQRQLQETKQQLSIVSEINEQQERQLIEQKPKVLFAESVETSEDAVLVAELAKVLTQNGYPIGQNRLFEELRERGFLCKSGSYKNQPAQRYQEMGLFEIQKRNIQNPDGTIRVTATTKVTGKGLVYFVNYFLNNKKSA